MSRADPAVVLAVDVGGTSFKGAVVDAAGRPHHEEAVVLAGRTGEAAAAALETLFGRLQAAATLAGQVPVAAGLVTPGMDEATGRVVFSSNLGWTDLPLAARLEGALGLPVAAGHDVRTAGLAEGRLGAGRGLRDVAFVMIGTGIAAALLVSGTPVTGAARQGGEFGHMPVYPDGDACPCGQRGCLEAYASAAAIARRYRTAGGAAAGLTAAEVAAAQGHDAVARKVWGEAVEALALGLASLTMLLDPAVVILGGGLSQAGPVLLRPLQAALAARLAWRAPPPLRLSRLGPAAARTGAAMLAFGRAGRGEVLDAWGGDPDSADGAPAKSA